MPNNNDLDTYGRCGDLKCPGTFATDCPALNDYKFYLAFENSGCSEYITEKVWWNAFAKTVPVVLGGKLRRDYETMLPPKSFIYVEDFRNPADLAALLLFLGEHDTFYMKLHEWRRYFKVLNEHAYFKSPAVHYCRVCEALNYNDPSPKTYERLDEFWSMEHDCRSHMF